METSTWQNMLNAMTLKAEKDGFLEEFESASTEEEKVHACLTNGFVRPHIEEFIQYSLRKSYGKDAAESNKYRKMGNQKFVMHYNEESLNLFTKSICYAPSDSDELPLALANRSAALFHMDCYEDCLQDIELSLEKGYPEDLQYKLFVRRGHCLAKLRRIKDSLHSFQSALKALDIAKNMSNENRDSLRKDILAAMMEIGVIKELDPAPVSESDILSRLPSPAYSYNENFLHASSALELKFSEEKGRYVETNQPLKMGDILFVEKPYAFVVLPDFTETHCQHCCTSLRNPVPCHQCSQAMYCNDNCRKQSWEKYHQYECGNFDLLHSIGIAHLGLRVVLMPGLKRLMELKKIGLLIPGDNIPDAPIEKYGNEEENYLAVYNLLTHIHYMKRGDTFQYALTACLLLLYLKEHTKFFSCVVNEEDESEVGDCATPEEQDKILSFVGGLLMRHVAQLVCNAHAITKLQLSSASDKSDQQQEVLTESQVRIATAIYPSASMMNHSCDSNIINSFCNQHLIVRANRDIPSGGEIHNCYGPHFRRMKRSERKVALKSQYFFDCKCKHCVQQQDYDFQERFYALLCPACGGPLMEIEEEYKEETDENIICRLKGVLAARVMCHCGDCGQDQGCITMVEQSFRAHELFNQGSTALKMGDVKDALHNFEECWEIRKQCLYRHNKDLLLCGDEIAKCYAMLGDNEKSIDMLLQCLPGIEEQFGGHSVEVANELQKVTDIMLTDLQQQQQMSRDKEIIRRKAEETRACIIRAKKILEVNYGIWSSELQDIVLKKRQLESICDAVFSDSEESDPQD